MTKPNPHDRGGNPLCNHKSRQQYVGIDLHRRRSVIVRMDETGKMLGVKRVPNDPVEFSEEMAEAGEGPEVVLEATYG